MLKALKNQWPWLVFMGVSALSVGLVVALLKTTDAFNPAQRLTAANPNVSAEQSSQVVKASTVLGLVKQPTTTRGHVLSVIAQKDNGIEGDRARYMLATDFINQGQGDRALPLLKDLAHRYRDMAPYVLLRKGQAQSAAGQVEAAQATWNQLISQYAGSGAAAEALFQLGNQTDNPAATTHWDTLLREIPNHPHSVDIALKKLSENHTSQNVTHHKSNMSLDELALLKLVAHYGINHPQYLQSLDRLVSQYSHDLSTDDWAAIGFGYWENQVYDKAGEAYAKVPSTPTHQYRAARGQQRGGKVQAAREGYYRLNQKFPSAPETAEGLLKLAQIEPSDKAISVLDQVIDRFPDRAAEALFQRADVLEDLQSPASAKQARASILTQYPRSEIAAEIRLERAKSRAQQGDIAGALEGTKRLTASAPETTTAAEAGFWLGKWALKSNQPDVARRAFEQVIRNHPESYFAWRSAVHLDWPVGDFDSVRDLTPAIFTPARRSPLPAGSTTLQELYLLGHEQTAWNQWQTEFANQQMPSVAEQFTDGILRLGVGDHLVGIFMVSSLDWRDRPDDIREHALLKKDPAYWQAIYPFPFAELIMSYAQQRALNPLLVTALIRQESRFQPDIRSVVGAVGLMQVMPETAEWIAQQTSEASYNLTAPENNIKLGTWYLDYTHREFGNNALFAVASYNAGPGSVATWIDKGGFTNADEFVEIIPYPETKGYISAVFGGYWNYLRLYNPAIADKVAAL